MYCCETKTSLKLELDDKIWTRFITAWIRFSKEKNLNFRTLRNSNPLLKSEIVNKLWTRFITGQIMVSISTSQNFRRFCHISSCRFWKFSALFSNFLGKFHPKYDFVRNIVYFLNILNLRISASLGQPMIIFENFRQDLWNLWGRLTRGKKIDA